MRHLSKLHAAFTQAVYEREGNFTKYVFTFHASFIEWRIEKRYSQFEKLHKELTKLQTEDVCLPELPSKIFWKKNSELNVQRRAQHLEKYLNELLSIASALDESLILDFIEIEEEVYCLLQSMHSLSSTSKSSFHSPVSSLVASSEPWRTQSNLYANLYRFHKKSTAANDVRVRVIGEFLSNLEENKQNQGDIVRSFEEFFDEHSHESFSNEEIALLFKGITPRRHFNEEPNAAKPINGLLFHIGNYKDNLLGSIACLEFLLKLLSCDKNYDYERYIQVLKVIDIKYISMIKCKELINSPHGALTKLSYQLCSILLSNQFEIGKLLNYDDYITLIEDIKAQD